MKTPVAVLFCLLAACRSPDSGVGPDAGPPVDAGVRDAGVGDAGQPVADAGFDRCEVEPDCASVVAFSTRLDVEPNRLNALRLTVCQGAFCATARPVLTSKDSAALPSADCAAAFPLSCVLSRRADGRFNATVSLVLPTGVTPTDGDSVSLEVKDATNGATLARVERQAELEVAEPGSQCGCRAARQFVLPTSASNLRCATRPCGAGARFTATVALTGSEPSVRVCREAACVTAPLAWAEALDEATASLDEPLAGGNVRLTKSGARFALELNVPAAPDELADTDRYTLEIGGTPVIDRTVSYDVSSPNGAACDAVSCRKVAVALP